MQSNILLHPIIPLIRSVNFTFLIASNIQLTVLARNQMDLIEMLLVNFGVRSRVAERKRIRDIKFWKHRELG